MLEPCWAREFLNIACPACGMTRSFLCLLNGDIISSFQFNPLLTLASLWGLLFLYIKKDENKKVWLCRLGVVILVVDWIYCIAIYT